MYVSAYPWVMHTQSCVELQFYPTTSVSLSSITVDHVLLLIYNVGSAVETTEDISSCVLSHMQS